MTRSSGFCVTAKVVDDVCGDTEWDLGRNTMGKINKRRLRAPYWEVNV